MCLKRVLYTFWQSSFILKILKVTAQQFKTIARALHLKSSSRGGPARPGIDIHRVIASGCELMKKRQRLGFMQVRNTSAFRYHDRAAQTHPKLGGYFIRDVTL